MSATNPKPKDNTSKRKHNHKTTFPLPVKMRSPHNAAWDVLNELGMLQTVRETVSQDPENPRRWLVTFESVPGSLTHSRLHVEVMEGEPHAYACVLDRRNVGYRMMTHMMDRLMRRLERPPRASPPSGQQPSAGSPPASPERDRHDSQDDDRSDRTPPHTRRT